MHRILPLNVFQSILGAEFTIILYAYSCLFTSTITVPCLLTKCCDLQACVHASELGGRIRPSFCTLSDQCLFVELSQAQDSAFGVRQEHIAAPLARPQHPLARNAQLTATPPARAIASSRASAMPATRALVEHALRALLASTKIPWGPLIA